MRWNCLVTALFLLLLFAPARGEESLTATPLIEAGPAESPQVNATEPWTSAPEAGEPADTTNLFGGRTGYIHPSLSVSGYYTSNLFRTQSDEESDFYTVITPGLWLALPARNQRLPEIGTLNTAPGGLNLSRFTMERERRVQGYLLYQANIVKYDQFEDENRVDHRAQAMLKLSSRSNLSLEIADVFERNSDPYGTGAKAEPSLDTFDANLFNVILLSRLSPKVLLRADYGNYQLDYADIDNTYRDRSDNSYSGYLFYQATPKTAAFLQGEHIAIDYDEGPNDSRHNNYYLGFQMQTSANTRGQIKVGYGLQDYEDGDETSAFLAEAQVDYSFTPKTSVYLQGSRRILEPDVDQSGVRNILSHRLLLGYRQRMTAKWSGDGNLFINHSDYDGTMTIGNRIASDYYHEEFGGRVTLGFAPLTWMNFRIGYEYRERDSNFDTEDFCSNTIFLRATAAL